MRGGSLLLPPSLATAPRLHRGKLLVAATSLCVLLFCIPILEGEATDQRKSWLFYICGGCLGVCGSLFVICTYFMYPSFKKHPSPIHFHRTICSFFIGLIAISYPHWMQSVCGDNTCSMNDKGDDEPRMDECRLASSLLQFFELASEGWFLCVSLDIRVSLNNPFSNYTSRMLRYHIFSWTVGLVTAVLMYTSGLKGFAYSSDLKTSHADDFGAEENSIYGFWYITQDVDDTVFCWFKSDNKSNLLSANAWTWFLLYIPLLLVYVYSLVTIFQIFKKLRQGLSNTFHQRLGVLVRNSCNLLVYILYWFVLGVLYMMSFLLADRNPVVSAWCWRFLLFGLAAKGFADMIVWLVVQNLEHAHQETNIENVDDVLKPTVNLALQQEVLYYATTGIKNCALSCSSCPPSMRKRHYMMKRREREAAHQIDFMTFLTMVFSLAADDALLSPQGARSTSRAASSQPGSPTARLTVATQRQSVWQQVAGLFRSPILEDEDTDVEGEPEDEDNVDELERPSRDSVLGVFTDDRGSRVDRSSLYGSGPFRMVNLSRAFDRNERFNSMRESLTEHLPQVKIDFEGWARFVEYAPYCFRRIRSSMNLSDDEFARSFKKTAKARVTAGGASGAFFFFSGDERFIAKSCTAGEMRELRRIADQYATYVSGNPETFIVRILGAYSLTIYGNRFYFMVMQNIFYNRNKDVPTLRYDIKGSWVNRNASYPRIGEQVTCLHCNQKFTFYQDGRRRKERCRVTATGLHQPQTVYKDNDLNTKVRLGKELSAKTLNQLQKDTDALRSFDVMDYSLLLGVCTQEYAVDLRRPDAPELVEYKEQDARAESKDGGKVVQKVGTGERFEVSRVVAPAYYYFGIIDILQPWNFKKQLERAIKTKLLGHDPAGVSAIEVPVYQERFMKKMAEIIEA